MVCHAGVNCEDKLLHFHEMLHAAGATYSFLTDKSDVWPTRGKDCLQTYYRRKANIWRLQTSGFGFGYVELISFGWQST